MSYLIGKNCNNDTHKLKSLWHELNCICAPYRLCLCSWRCRSPVMKYSGLCVMLRTSPKPKPRRTMQTRKFHWATVFMRGAFHIQHICHICDLLHYMHSLFTNHFNLIYQQTKHFTQNVLPKKLLIIMEISEKNSRLNVRH